MQNELKDICDSLEGYSSDNLGFMVTKAEKLGAEGDSWLLNVEAYNKDSAEGITDWAVITLSERLYNRYSSGKAKFKVIFINEEVAGKSWTVKVKKVTDEEKGSEEE